MKIKNIIPYTLLVMLILVGCSTINKEQTIADHVRQMAETSELGTVEYTVKKIVKCNDQQRFIIGDRKILFQSTAYLKAGIKLDKFTADDVLIDEKTITVNLPHAELISFNMPAEETVTIFENYGFFRSRFNAEEQNEILTIGEKDIREDVPNLGILQDAEQNAKDVFTAMLTQMGFAQVIVNYKEK